MAGERRRTRTIAATLGTLPPEDYARWNGPLLARVLGGLHVQHVWRVLRARKIDLARRKSWRQSKDPEFTAKAADMVGLYVAPPENAIVTGAGEKPLVLALAKRWNGPKQAV